MIVFDTNVVSELLRPAPAPEVEEWVGRQPLGTRWTTAITVAELLFGVRRMPAGRRREDLAAAAERSFAAFANQVLAFDQKAAWEYAALMAAREGNGAPIDSFDAQIAAICLTHGAVLATRNVRHFGGLGLELVDPWAAAR